MKYKVGDKVRIKSLDWYNENKSKRGFIYFDYANFIPEMSQYCGEILTINQVVEEHKQYLVSECPFSWTDEMIEGLVEEEALKQYEVPTGSIKIWDLPNGYQFTDENGNVINATKIVLEKKKKEYPKTYEECCKVLNIAVRDLDILDNMLDTSDIVYRKNLDRLLNSFRKLLICRDAYWKIAGEDMGLGKPWELSIGTPIYYIYYNRTVGTIKNDYADDIQGNIILAFPTKEMRDAFYENFNPDIKICKELL